MALVIEKDVERLLLMIRIGSCIRARARRIVNRMSLHAAFLHLNHSFPQECNKNPMVLGAVLLLLLLLMTHARRNKNSDLRMNAWHIISHRLLDNAHFLLSFSLCRRSGNNHVFCISKEYAYRYSTSLSSRQTYLR